MTEATGQRIVQAIALVTVAVALVVSFRGLERLNTWYLASDQFAFLTLASDLREGRLTREDWLYDFMPAREQRAYDAYAQTYRLQEGRLHSRYPPGFAVILAVAGAVFGETGEHGVNPLLYLVVLLLLSRLTFVALADRDTGVAYGAAAAVPWLLLLLPTDVHLWGITVARDLPAHLLGLVSLLLAVRGRFGWSGFALGLGAVIRPDAALYAVAVGAVGLVRGRAGRAFSYGAVGFLIGALPLFAYNWAMLGSPLSFTQGSEFLYFLGSLSIASAAHAAVEFVPAGGGFRAVHFPGTMRGNLQLLWGSFGWFTLPAMLAAGWGLVRAPLPVAVFAPYAVVGTVFYGFWGHPDPRYLAGVSLCLMPLVAMGLVVACRRAADPGASVAWRVGALAIFILALGASFFDVGPAPGRTATASAGLVTVTALLSVRASPTERLRFLAPIILPLLLLGIALAEVSRGTGWRDPYSRVQIERARRIVEQEVPPGSVLITTPALGRPGENITHYTGVRAVYGGELAMVTASPDTAPTFHKIAGRRVFFLLPPGVVPPLSPFLAPVVRRKIPSDEALDWFLNPRQARGGAVLHEIEFDTSLLEPDALRALEASGLLGRSGSGRSRDGDRDPGARP